MQSLSLPAIETREAPLTVDPVVLTILVATTPKIDNRLQYQSCPVLRTRHSLELSRLIVAH